MEELPFKEEIKNSWYYRKFSKNLLNEELKWHWDDEDRLVVPLNENDWLIQLDDELPQEFNKPIFIEKNRIHRVIKGTGDLELKLKKFNEVYSRHTNETEISDGV
jgi:hypothetical protein